MMKSIHCTWGENPQYDAIILDYFFSPAGWVNARWTTKFFTDTLPCFVEKGLLKRDGTVWLPHVQHVTDMLDTFYDDISPFYKWSVVVDPHANPLCSATESVQDELLRCPDNLTNATQLKPLHPDGPFYALRPLQENEEPMERPERKRKEGIAISPKRYAKSYSKKARK
jgi:hypothetical protein